MENKQANKKLEDLPEVLSANMIAEYLSIGYVKALNLIQYGGIPHLKLGNTYRVAKRNFEVWLMDPNTKVIQFN